VLLPQLGLPERGVGIRTRRKAAEQPVKEISQQLSRQIQKSHRVAQKKNSAQSRHQNTERSGNRPLCALRGGDKEAGGERIGMEGVFGDVRQWVGAVVEGQKIDERLTISRVQESRRPSSQEGAEARGTESVASG
jgi:hypothetical protein